MFVDKGAMTRNLEDNKGDLNKISKGMAALTWTAAQRQERSLEGGRNNRFPDAPAKKAATPRKINACIGTLYLHNAPLTN